MEIFQHPAVTRLLRSALEEDVGRGDVTTLAIVLPGTRATGTVVAKERLVAVGLPLAEKVWQLLDTTCQARLLVGEGEWVQSGEEVLQIAGNARALLTGERTALNFLQHLSGIATLTRRYVEEVAASACVIMDTRKTLAGLRLLEKYAVRAGGGTNHRMGLDDGVLIKENHLAVGGGIREAVRRARQGVAPRFRIEVECTAMAEVEEALAAGADIILLDNMETQEIAAAVRMVANRALVEVSGGITLERVREVAATGVNFISVGALTHSARAVDLSMTITSHEGLRHG